MTWERARSEEQIEHRINEIIEATSRLFGKHRFEEITFAMIAQEANFTRSNLYRYFGTKEEVFLELIKHDCARWRNEVLESFSNKSMLIPEFSEGWVNLLLKHTRLINLFTILYTMLEQNASLESLIAFKRTLMEELETVTACLIRTLPFESADAATEFLMAQMSLAIGIYPMLNVTVKQQQAMDAVGMISTPEHFRAILVDSTTSLLRGLIDHDNN